jgi:transposase
MRVLVQSNDSDLAQWLYQKYVEEGKTLREIANEMGVSAQWVHQLMQRYGIERRSVGRRRIRLDVEKAKELYERGWSLRKIAGLFETSESTIRRYLIETGVSMRRNGWRKPEVERLFGGEEGRRLLWNLYIEKGMTTCEIAAMCGSTPMTVWRRLKEHGIPTRRRGPKREG